MNPPVVMFSPLARLVKFCFRIALKSLTIGAPPCTVIGAERLPKPE